MNLNSWLVISEDSDFSIHNIPFGVISSSELRPRVGVRIGEKVLDLLGVAELELLSDIDPQVFSRSSINAFMALGKEKTSAARLQIQKLLSDENSPLREHPDLLHDLDSLEVHLPVDIGDYTDFYSSIEHATNVGKMFRDPENALLPNWRHLPVGYHGRASSVVVSGTPVARPVGQVVPKNETAPVFKASGRVDFELEMGFVIGQTSALGNSISVSDAENYIFGLVLFNDWSARDIQKWEYVPLGPFLGKSFASSMSPWVVTLDALEFVRVTGPEQQPEVLPYLLSHRPSNFNIDLEVSLQPKGGEDEIISRSNFSYMYWNMAQQLAHHTSNGCNVRVGDLMASGTISGKDESSYGSMLELAWTGQRPLSLKDGSQRSFLHDGDLVTMRGHASKGGVRVGFGEVAGEIFPAK